MPFLNRQQRRAAAASFRATRDDWTAFEDRSHKIDEFSHLRISQDIQQCWANNRYAVLMFLRRQDDGSLLIHLAVRNAAGSAEIPWADLQRIKNEIVGPDEIAVEVFPREQDLVDEANMRHLFVWPKGRPCPFTIRGRWR